MSDILKRILATKFDEVAKASSQVAMHVLRADAEASIQEVGLKPRGFAASIEEKISQADIVVSAVGKPNFIKGNWIKNGSIIIDIGITRLNNNKIVGDVEFDVAKEKAAFITPVPGGVGPMTVATLMENTLIAQKLF